MRKRFYMLLIMAFSYQLGTTQSDFTQSELEDFVHIYMTSKSKQIRSTSEDEQLFKRYNITRERYQSITKTGLTGQKEDLTPQEVEFLHALKDLIKKTKLEKELQLDQLCQENNLPLDRYNLILEKYRSDIGFQRSLQPYFKTYFKSLK